MKKIIFLTNLIAVSAVMGMQGNFTEENHSQSKNPMRLVNANDSGMVRSYESFTDRDWILKIVTMSKSKEDFNAPQNANGQTILMCATRYANCKIMQQVLNVKDDEGNRHADINAQDINGDTALSIAAKSGDDEKILLLLKNSADVELAKKKVSGKALEKLEKIYQQVQKATTDFVFAINMGNISRAKSLLKNTPVDVNMSVRNPIFGTSSTALISAVELRSTEMLELLLKQPNIDINMRDDHGGTALIYAVTWTQGLKEKFLQRPDVISILDWGQKPIVELLLKHPNIDVNVQDNHQRTALMYAAFNDRKEAVKLLLKHPNIDVNLQDDNGSTILMGLALAGEKEIVELLLKFPDIEINKKCNMGGTALMMAAALGQKEIVELLINQLGIDINLKDEKGGTALHQAVMNGHEDVVKLLLEHPNIDVNGNHMDSYALMLSVVRGQEEIVRLLLEKGADINKKYCAGEFTALMCAVEGGYRGIVNLILNQPGININTRNAKGETALDCANRKGRRIIIRLIQSKMGLQNQQVDPFIEKIKHLSSEKVYEKFIYAVSQGDINKMDSLLEERGADIKNIVNAKNKKGDSSLIIASDKGNLEAVRLLLEYGADFSLKDVSGDNALIKAARKGYFDVVEELLFRKANINSVGQHGRTALMEAAENGQVRVVKLLIKKGAKSSVKDDYGKTALDLVNEKLEKFNKSSDNYKSIKSILENQSKQSNQLFNEAKTKTLSNKWEIVTDKNYEKDLKDWEKNDPTTYNKVQQLVKNVEFDPFRGLGQVEPLKGDLEGLYSRRINKQNRLVYEIDGEKIILKSCKGHYEKDKRNRSRTNSEI